MAAAFREKLFAGSDPTRTSSAFFLQATWLILAPQGARIQCA